MLSRSSCWQQLHLHCYDSLADDVPLQVPVHNLDGSSSMAQQTQRQSLELMSGCVTVRALHACSSSCSFRHRLTHKLCTGTANAW